MEQQDVFLENTQKTNKRIMWLAFSTNAIGPLLAIGTWGNYFQVRYLAALEISYFSLMISLILMYMNRHPQWVHITKVAGLVMLELLICRMGMSATIGINISYAMIPIISCLYVEETLTIWMNIMSLLVLTVSMYFRSFEYVSVYGGNLPQQVWYVDNTMGFGVEFIFVFILTWSIVKYEKELLKNLEVQVKRKAKAEEISEIRTNFFSRVSHELRTPMNAICGMSDLLAAKSLDEESHEYARTIQKASREMLSVINTVLDISRIHADKMQLHEKNYDPRELFTESMRFASFSVMDKKLEMKTKMDRFMPQTLYGDAEAITRILLNLLNNAMKYTQSGSIILRASWTETVPQEGILHIEVEDTGCGIKKEDLKRIFEPFEQTMEKVHSKYTGTGLGLTICESYAELMGGKLWAESDEGKGSIFFVDLPQKKTQEIQTEGKAEKENAEMASTFTAPDVRILLVDDNKTNIQVALALMKDYQFKITVCLNGEKALKLLAGEIRFDLILMDHLMPGLNGIETTEQIRAWHTEYADHIPIIALTANLVGNLEEIFRKSGMNDVLEKPIDRYQLDDMLRKWLPSEKCHKR